MLDRLRARIHALERSPLSTAPRLVAPSRGAARRDDPATAAGAERAERSPGGGAPSLPPPSAPTAGTLPVPRPRSAAAPGAWCFGDPGLDAVLPPGALAEAATHELKPATADDWPSALALALRLAVRRLAVSGPAPVVLWCASGAHTGEHGRLHAPGLAALGLSPDRLLVALTAREADTLWAMEEGLRSRAPALVVGCLQAVGLTASRRLSLAAAEAGIPCLLLTAPRSPVAPAAVSRWRIARRPAARHPFDPQAPGAPRLALTLERCRGASLDLAQQAFVVEWCDGTHRFRLAAGLAHRSAAPGEATSGAPRAALRAG